jgi:hypothetical protein
MRLNDLIPCNNQPTATDAQSLLKGVFDAATKSLAINPFIKGLSHSFCQEFFEKYYIKPNTNGQLHQYNITTPLSIIEADILNFFLSNASQSTPYLFVDHAGRGKTTILKYINYYLCHKEPDLQNYLMPLYLSLKPHETTISGFIKAVDVHVFLRQMIKERAFSEALDHFVDNAAEILNWINRDYPSTLQGIFPSNKIGEIATHPEEFVEKLASNNPPMLTSFIVGVLCHYSTYRLPIVLLIDDADNFSIDIQRSVLDFAKQKISMGLRVLVALRVSTWKTLESDRRDYEPHISRQQINWSVEDLKKFLLVRLENAREFVSLQTQYRTDVQKRDVVNAFIDSLSTDKSADFIVRTSNYNLHSLMRKLAMMPHSWYFNDKYLLRERLIAHTTPRAAQGFPMWRTFNLILGSYCGSFQSNDDVARSGIVNLFCTKDDKHEPYTFFVRIHILACLRDATKESSARRMKTIQDEYRDIFGENLNFSRVFCRTLYRLVQAGLAVTVSCRRYKSVEEVREHIGDDSVFITEAGLYYLCWLINRIDYLYFMKDDIDWPDDFNVEKVEYAKVGTPRADRFRNTLRALKLLMDQELKMLSEIQDQLRKPGAASLAVNYVTWFSGKRVGKGGGDILFTVNMLEEYRKYLKWSFPNYQTEFADEFKHLDIILDSYKDLRGAFRC